jgi:Domain of unknown function (DUF4340)
MFMKFKENRNRKKLKQKRIFQLEEKAIQNLTIEKEGKIVAFARTKNQQQPWQMKQPEDVPASDAAVSFLVNLLVSSQSERSFTVTKDKLKDYGLDAPFATITFTTESQQKQQIILGKSDFNNQFLYAQIDPKMANNSEVQILLVPLEFKYAVNRDLEEWKQL